MKKRNLHKRLLPLVFALLLLIGASAVYVSDYYRTDTAAAAAFAPDKAVPETVLYEGAVAYGAPDAEVGFLFYPGGKVEYTAYAPLLRQLAAQDILCVLLKMPCNLAVLDSDAADGIREYFPAVERWYIGGHSLGGSMAAYYAADHAPELEGLILLGSYSSRDLSQSSLRVLSVFGSEDRVLNREKYEECQENLPAGWSEIKIDGGCHAYFGMYGTQKGDGMPALSAEEQIRLSAAYISEFLFTEVH